MSSKYFFKNGDKNSVVSQLRDFLYSRWYLTSVPKNKVCSDVFDASMAAMLIEYQQFNSLSKQSTTFNINTLFSTNSILNEATYKQIGSEMTAAEIDAISIHDVEVKKLLYGIASMDLCDTWDTIAPVIAKDKFIGWGHEGINENCFDYCKEQMRVVRKSMKSPWWGRSTKMNPNIYQLYLTKDVAGMKKGIQVKQFADGVTYLKSALKSSNPVVVGVEDGAGSPNTDQVTDHFVVIVGMGTDVKGKYFLFYDNATGDKDSGTSDQNQLYCNCNNFEIRGTAPNAYIQATQLKAYIVTQIRETN